MAKSTYKVVKGALHYKEIRNLIDGASKYLILCTPYWWYQPKEDDYKDEHLLTKDLPVDFLSEILLPILRTANKDVKVLLIAAKKYYNNLRSLFECNELDKSIFVCYSDNFHCKVYMNEKRMLVTSMNLCNNNNNDVGHLSENDINLRDEVLDVIRNCILQYSKQKQVFDEIVKS